MKLRFIFICMALCAVMMGCEDPNSGTNPKVGFIDKVPLTDMEQSELDAIFTERNYYLHNYASTLNGENTVNVIGSRAELYDLVGPGVVIGDLKSIDFKKHCIVYGVVRTSSSGNTFSKAELYMQADGKATFQTTIDMISINCAIGYVFPYAVFDIPKKDIQQINIQVELSTPKRNKKAFSVSSTEQVVFSMGNLQYHPKNNEWRFAESQWNIIGGANENISTTYDGWIDLFGWSTDGHEATKWGVSTSSDWNDYTGDFVDWGINTIGNDAPNTWRTLNIDEWSYLIEQRPHHSELMGIAQVNGINGTILLPDGWECPAGIVFKPGLYEEHYNYPDEKYFAMQQTFSLEQWLEMEAAGAIFLPNAGIRRGDSVYDTQGLGCYWSSTRGSNLTAYSYEFGGISVATGIINEMHKDARSVRLVKNCDSSNTPTEPYGDETELAIQIAQLVEGENYNDVLTLLDKIVVKDNYSMKIVPFYEKDTFDMFADTSPVVIYNEQGEWLSTNFEDDFWNYLQVENSQMGAWQAYLLSQMWHYLPLQWHANYSYRDYIYSQSSKSYDILREHFIAGKHQVAPQITQEGDKFLISACYWSEFEGLVCEHYAVTFENDRVYVEELDANILYEYDCGIQF